MVYLKQIICICIFVIPTFVLASSANKPRMPFDNISLAGLKPGMQISMLPRSSSSDVRQFNPVFENGKQVKLKHVSRVVADTKTITETILATNEGIITKIVREREYTNSFLKTPVLHRFTTKYGDYIVSGNISGEYSRTYCWYGCETTLSGYDDDMRVFLNAEQFYIEIVGHTEIDLKQGFSLPEKGVIVMTLANGKIN